MNKREQLTSDSVLSAVRKGLDTMPKQKVENEKHIPMYTYTADELEQIKSKWHKIGYADGMKAMRESFIDILDLDNRYQQYEEDY